MATRNDPNRCYMARVMRQNRRYKKDFYFKDFGGSPEKACAAAERWEVAMDKILPTRLSAKGRMTTRNHSGVVGVHLGQQINHRPYKTYHYWRWVADWPGCPRTGGLGWSTHQWGDDDAFALAFISRREESIDRPKIIEEMKSIRGTEEYADIMTLKQQKAPETEPSGDPSGAARLSRKRTNRGGTQ